MRLIAFFNADGQPALGARSGDEVVDLTRASLPATLDELLRRADGLQAARQVAESASATRQPLAGLKLLPPIYSPSKAFAVGLNYVDHASESNLEPPRFPVLFQRYPSSWVAHAEPIVRPKASVQFDYEAELVVVIGRSGRNIEKAKALEHVAGYSLFNDGSIRDFQFRSSQWLWGKNFDQSGSFGPEFVSADELPPGAHGLHIECRLNGQVMQSANTRDMIFDVATLIAACSEGITLQPGDIIITGTPSGVGAARKPPVFMKAGDICEVEVEGVGVLRNSVVDEA